MDERILWYWLLSMESVGNSAITHLLDRYGTVGRIWESGPLPTMNEQQKSEFIDTASDMKRLEREYAGLQERGIRLILRSDPEYPAKLKGIHDEPYGLFVKGGLPSEYRPAVAVIGARKASQHGKYMAEKLASELAAHGIDIISGMAEGIDVCGHRGAMNAGGKTYAVMGCGIDICYPRTNLHEYMRVLETGGGIISEYPPGRQGLPFNFPARNRIISALAELVLVVEAREKSGSLITVDRALEQGREVMAVPGRPDDPLSSGCNALIRQGAEICTCAEDVLFQLGLLEPEGPGRSSRTDKTGTARQPGTPAEISLSPEQAAVAVAIGPEPVHVDRLIELTGMPLSQLMGILIKLEMLGVIVKTSPTMYQHSPLYRK